MSKAMQIEILENGMGIQYLLDSAHRILGNPLCMFDTNYNLIAYTEVPMDDPVWIELTTTGTFGIETQQFFAREYFTEHAANVKKSAVLKSERLNYARMMGYVYSKDRIKIAVISMYEVEAPFDAELTSAFEAFLDKMRNEIQHVDYYVYFAKAYHEKMIISLLDGLITERAIYTPHVQILYDGFEDYLYLAVISVSESNLHPNNAIYYRFLLERMYRTFKFAVYDNYIVMIMSSKLKKIDERLFFNIPNNPFQKYNLHTGISGCFENLYELRDYYEDALRVLNDGMSGGGGRHIYLSEYSCNGAACVII
ncbi:MAG: hypothetical protein FWH01_03035 [Oscillospiraceae bacterium]|nr:hypothetical protein [Oscillospiraceae bacterium]